MAAFSQDSDDIVSSINVTPLVDVVLVLLVVMMVAASAIAARGLPVELPRAKTGETANRSTPLSITVRRDHTFYLDGRLIPRASLVSALKARAANEKSVAELSADGGAEHRDVVAAMDALRQVGISRFAIRVDQSDPVPATVQRTNP